MLHSTRTTRIYLKARPTPAQLADRLAEPTPEGLELYLDRADLNGNAWLERLGRVTAVASALPDFGWIVEAPIRTLGNQYFDLTNDDADHRETLRRVIRAGEALRAHAANLHVVAPSLDPSALSEERRRRDLDRALPLLANYVDRCDAAGMIPQVENVPPVGRMREGAFVYSAIGAAPADLRELADRFPALRFTLDVSHAALYLNWRRAASVSLEPVWRAVAEFHRMVDDSVDLADVVRRLAERTLTVHVSNARGLLGEGLGYDEGDESLDAALAPLVGEVGYFVTETLEPDPDHASGMREAQRRLHSLRNARLAGGGK